MNQSEQFKPTTERSAEGAEFAVVPANEASSAASQVEEMRMTPESGRGQVTVSLLEASTAVVTDAEGNPDAGRAAWEEFVAKRAA